jgi:hypothetical protein
MRNLWGHSPLELISAAIVYLTVSVISVGVAFAFVYMQFFGSWEPVDYSMYSDPRVLVALGILSVIVAGVWWYHMLTKPFTEE